MHEDRFNVDELREPKPMTLYWALIRSFHDKKVHNELVLVLKVTNKSIKIVPLRRGKLMNHYPVKYISKRHFKITGLASDVCNYDYNDFLTCDSEVIRKHAAEYYQANKEQ